MKFGARIMKRACLSEQELLLTVKNFYNSTRKIEDSLSIIGQGLQSEGMITTYLILNL